MLYNVNSELFLEYIIQVGKFNPEHYEKILELGQSVPNSMSIFLREYRQYLLSKEVKYDEIDQYGIDGAMGYIYQNQIPVPKSLKNDARFITNSQGKTLFRRYGYLQPTIDEFDSIICVGLNANLFDTMKLKQDKFFGLCLDLYDDKNIYKSAQSERNKQLRMKIMALFNDINNNSSDNFEMCHDIDSDKGKELYLIRKAK